MFTVVGSFSISDVLAEYLSQSIVGGWGGVVLVYPFPKKKVGYVTKTDRWLRWLNMFNVLDDKMGTIRKCPRQTWVNKLKVHDDNTKKMKFPKQKSLYVSKTHRWSGRLNGSKSPVRSVPSKTNVDNVDERCARLKNHYTSRKASVDMVDEPFAHVQVVNLLKRTLTA